MKKRIHLTERQLHKLIEQTLNEISIQTKMNAANKAQREADDYWERVKNPDNPNPRYAKNMRHKRYKQAETFSDAVNDEMDKLPFVSHTSFWPGSKFDDKLEFNQRGGMNTYMQPTTFNSYGKTVFPSNIPDEERDKKFNDVEQYLKGNSYYEKGRGWVNPDDEGYDKEKSEPWAKIRQNNESLARRVTESIVRKIRESVEDEHEYYDEGENSAFVSYLADAIYNEAVQHGCEDYEYLAGHPNEVSSFDLKVKYQEGNTIIYGILKFDGRVSQDIYDIILTSQDFRKKVVDGNGNTVSTEAYHLDNNILTAVGENLADSNAREFSLWMYMPDGYTTYADSPQKNKTTYLGDYLMRIFENNYRAYVGWMVSNEKHLPNGISIDVDGHEFQGTVEVTKNAYDLFDVSFIKNGEVVDKLEDINVNILMKEMDKKINGGHLTWERR